jgi:polysaccharide biosynthesis/export protein
MKRLLPVIALAIIIASSCVSQKKLRYLGPTPDSGGMENFPMEIHEYRLKPHDILYITVKAMGTDGKIEDFLSGGVNSMMTSGMGDATTLYGYEINEEGSIILPGVGDVKVNGLTLLEAKRTIQESAIKIFRNATVECKLLSFKYTVIGEVKAPGTFTNNSTYLTLLEAIGKAGGITDVGNRDRVTVVRPYEGGTRTYRVNIQDNKIFSSEAYSLLPNDVIIVEPTRQKILLQNMPTFTSIVGVLTAILLFLNYVK